MQWQKLTDIKTSVSRGSVFRVRGKSPYEQVVDFMVYDPHDSNRGLGIVVVSGYKAGLPLVIFPVESYDSSSGSLDRDWLINNWSKWVYPECPVEFVEVAENYTVEQ